MPPAIKTAVFGEALIWSTEFFGFMAVPALNDRLRELL